MPLAHTPYRPRPVVELLGMSSLDVEEAARGLGSAVGTETSTSLEPQFQYDLPGSTLVNYRQIPGIAEALQTDWVSLPQDERPQDCFVEVRGRLETHMHPCFLGEKLALGLRGAAGMLLLRFSPVLRCVPLGFTRLRPAGGYGAVVGESPYVHFLADFRAVGFVPKKGQWLIGRPSEQQTRQGLNVLILNCFNMFVRKMNLPSELRFDAEKSSWVYGEKAHRLRSQRGSIWVQNTASALISRGLLPSLTGILQWPLPPGTAPTAQQTGAESAAAGSAQQRPAQAGSGAAGSAEPTGAARPGRRRGTAKVAGGMGHGGASAGAASAEGQPSRSSGRSARRLVETGVDQGQEQNGDGQPAKRTSDFMHKEIQGSRRSTRRRASNRNAEPDG